MAKDKTVNEEVVAQPDVVIDVTPDTNPLPPVVVDVPDTSKTANQEADEADAVSGYVWGLSLNHYEQRTEEDLKREKFSDSDIERIKRVMAVAGKSLAAESFYDKREAEEKPASV